MIRRWLVISVVLALAAGTILSLPAFWGRPTVGQKSAQIARHWLDCVFTATSALTGTSLSPHDIAEDFNRTGQALILGLMQAGGLGVLLAGGVVGWRFRRRFGWGNDDEDSARAALPRLIVFVCVLTFLLEAAGAAAFYCSTAPSPDGPPRSVFAAVFHAVSAFCNAGLTLNRDSFMAKATSWPLYATCLPLVVLGTIGGPVLYELWRRLVNKHARSGALSRDTRVTLIGTAGLIVGGAAVIFFTESTPRWQLRNPREDTPGRLMVADPSPGDAIVFSADDSSAAGRQRMRTMDVGQRAAAALFHSVSARTAGFRTARLDEKSLSPAGRMVLTALMLAGGGLGGTAGGLRIVIVVVLLGTLCRRSKAVVSTEPGQEARAALLRAATAVAVAMFLLIGFSTLALVYRESATVEECAFEAVSACTNTGFTAGLTHRLSPECQALVILAMLLGRVIPLAVLAHYVRPFAEPPSEPGDHFGSKGADSLVSVPE